MIMHRPDPVSKALSYFIGAPCCLTGRVVSCSTFWNSWIKFDKSVNILMNNMPERHIIPAQCSLTLNNIRNGRILLPMLLRWWAESPHQLHHFYSHFVKSPTRCIARKLTGTARNRTKMAFDMHDERVEISYALQYFKGVDASFSFRQVKRIWITELIWDQLYTGLRCEANQFSKSIFPKWGVSPGTSISSVRIAPKYRALLSEVTVLESLPAIR